MVCTLASLFPNKDFLSIYCGSGLLCDYGNGQGTNCCNGHPGPSPITARLVGLQLRNPLILLALDKGNARPSKRHPTSP